MKTYDFGFGVSVDVWNTKTGREAKIKNEEIHNGNK